MFWSNYTTIVRRGCEIILPKSILKECEKNKYRIMLVKNKNNQPTSVQVTTEKYNPQTKKNKITYIGTLKDCLGASGFKDGNPCNFKKSNLIFE